VRENERPQTANFEDARVHSSTYTNQVYIMYIYLYFTCIQMKYIVGIDMYIIRALAPWLLMLLCWKISVYRRPFLERGPSIYSFSYGNHVYIRNIDMYIMHILAPSFWMELCVSFAEYRLFYRALLQKRPVILRSLLIVATPYIYLGAVILDGVMRENKRLQTSVFEEA